MLHFIDYIKEHWPFLYDRFPVNCDFKLSRKNFLFIYSTHLDFKVETYIDSRRGIEFIEDNNVPSGYYSICLNNTAGAEYLITMWRDKEHKFWFFDQYARFMGDGKFKEMELTTRHLKSALKKWDRGNCDVIFSGPWGYYTAESMCFSRDKSAYGKTFLNLRTSMDHEMRKIKMDIRHQWIEQCEASIEIKERYGTSKALGYLIGEKLFNLLREAEKNQTFEHELICFCTAIKKLFEQRQIKHYLENIKKTGALGHVLTDEENNLVGEFIENDIVEAAENIFRLEKIKSLLLESEGNSV